MEITGVVLVLDSQGLSDRATIDISHADLKAQLKPTKELKVGDTVWMAGKVARLLPHSFGINFQDKQECCYHSANPSEIIAHFPAEQEKENIPLQTEKHRNKARELLGNSYPEIGGVEALNAISVVASLLADIEFLKEEQEKTEAELPKKINPYEFPPYSKPIVEMIEAINQLNAVVKEMREKGK